MIAIPIPKKKPVLNTDRILRHLDAFRDPEFRPGGWQVRPGAGGPRLEYNRAVLEFVSEVQNGAWTPEGFRWIGWQKEAAQYREQPELVDSADLETCRRLLAIHVQMDRHRDGHLGEMIREGLIGRVLARIKTLSEIGELSALNHE